MLTKEQIEQIVEMTVAQMNSQAKATAGNTQASGNGWMFDRAEDCIKAAGVAQKQLVAMSMEARESLIRAMRKAAVDNAERLAQMAHDETGYGKVPDKNPEDPAGGQQDAWHRGYCAAGIHRRQGDDPGGAGAVRRHRFHHPFHNPPGTVINNSISMIAGGNAVVFNPHPSAKKCCQETMRILNDAIVAAGGPVGLICCPTNPSLETSDVIMNHPDIKLLSVTGGEAVVSVAMKTGKKCISAGAGQPAGHRR